MTEVQRQHHLEQLEAKLVSANRSLAAAVQHDANARQALQTETDRVAGMIANIRRTDNWRTVNVVILILNALVPIAVLLFILLK